VNAITANAESQRRIRRPREPQGRRIFVCRLADGRFLFVLFDCEIGLPITVFCEGMVIRCEGKGTIRLGVPHDLR